MCFSPPSLSYVLLSYLACSSWGMSVLLLFDFVVSVSLVFSPAFARSPSLPPLSCAEPIAPLIQLIRGMIECCRKSFAVVPNRSAMLSAYTAPASPKPFSRNLSCLGVIPGNQ